MDYLWHDHDTHISISVKTEEEPSSVGLHRASPAKVDVQEDKVEEEVAGILQKMHKQGKEQAKQLEGMLAMAVID